MAKSAEELQQELARLQAELQRRQLEEQIRQLQGQIEQASLAKTTAPPSSAAAPPPAVEPAVNHDDGEEEEEEYIEEEVVEESEAFEEEEEVVEGNETTPSPSSEPAPPRRKWPFGKQAQQQQQEPAAAPKKLSPEKLAAMTAPPPPPKPELPPLPPFTPRVIPKTPDVSPPGSETPMEVWLGPKLYKGGKMIACPTNAGLDGMDFVLLYIGASFNRECKEFLPLLSDFYQLCSQGPDALFECVYISRDRNMVMFKEAFAKMPWLSMPPGTSQLKNKLAQDLKLLDQPCLVVMERLSGNVICTNGVDQIMSLERRVLPHAQALVNHWKNSTPMTPDEIPFDTRLKNGTMQRGTLYWQE